MLKVASTHEMDSVECVVFMLNEELAKSSDKIVALRLTPGSGGMTSFKNEFPDRMFDVGIVNSAYLHRSRTIVVGYPICRCHV